MDNENNRSLFHQGLKETPKIVSTPLHAPPPEGLLSRNSVPMRTTPPVHVKPVNEPKISADLKSALPKLGSAKANRVRDVVARK